MRRFAKIVDRVVVGSSHVAYNPFPMDRGFYVPKDVPVEQVTPEGTDLDIRIYEKNGQLFGVAFAGRANKPLWNYRFRDRAQLDREIAEAVESRKSHMDYRKQRQQERQQFKHSFQVGDILYSSWGYDQTNIDFYQVTAVGDRSIKIREIGQKTARQETGADYVVAVPNSFQGAEMVKMVRPGDSVRISSYASAYKWDGKPKYQTAFGYGH
jgi:hypothetical protein